MKTVLAGCAAVTLVFCSVPPCLANEGSPIGKVMSEAEARIISARLYASLLIRVCKNGRRYPLSQVKSGFRRHFNEFKLQLANDGYTVVPGRARNGGRPQGEAFTVVINDGLVARSGCDRQYWLDEQ